MTQEYDKHCINAWSGPRCCSTSLMYSFAQRTDTQVLDEPLYANYLKLSGYPRPYRDQVLAAQENDGNKVVHEVLLGPRTKPVLYAKHIAKHKFGIDHSIWAKGQHILLVRDPYGVVQSFSKVVAPTLLELGYTSMLEIVSELRLLGRKPIVVMSDELIRAPEAVLRALCAALELPWQPSMLHWAQGPKPYDGVWAPWWYGNTHKSTGFDFSYRDDRTPLPDKLKPLLGECWPAYEQLRALALRPIAEAAPSRGLSTPRAAPLGRLTGLQDSGDFTAAASSPVSSAAANSLAATLSSAANLADTGAAGQLPGGEGAPGSSIYSSSVAGKSGTHVYVADPRNADVLVGMRDGCLDTFDLVWRPQARVSVLDSAFMLGDGVWEGLRVVGGVVAFAAAHLGRLWEGAKALDMDLGLTQAQLLNMIYATLDANGMANASGIHVRLMVSRGLKPTPYQAPATTLGKPTIVILPEWKEAAAAPKAAGIRLFTVHVRRGAPDVQDPGWNSHSKLNCISACIQAAKAGADEALMLDPHGFVATCNSVNFFIVREGAVWAPRSAYLMNGITRRNVMALAESHGLALRERDFSLTQVYSADEAFATGTFAGVLPVVEVDGRVIGNGARGPLTEQLQLLYADLLEAEAAAGREAAWAQD